MKKDAVSIPIDKEVESKKRLREFAEKLDELQKQYQVRMYPVNQAQQNGEVIPTIKIMDNFKTV